jgi:hypothetical protein
MEAIGTGLYHAPHMFDAMRLMKNDMYIVQTHDHCSLYISHRFVGYNLQIWNCYNDEGQYIGQATLFDRNKVEFLDPPSIM